MRCTVRIADRVVSVTSFVSSLEEFLKDYLCDAPPEMHVDVSEADVALYRVKEERGEVPPYPFPEEAVLHHKLSTLFLDCDTLLVHGSCVAIDGGAYIFAALSGTGKSTHARLWRKVFGSRVTMVNDDKPYVHVGDDGATAYGSPWDGKHHLSANIAAPLKAICLLSRGETNRIRPLPPEEAFPVLFYNQAFLPELEREPMEKSAALLERLSHQVKFYALECNMQPEAAQVAYDGMVNR